MLTTRRIFLGSLVATLALAGKAPAQEMRVLSARRAMKPLFPEPASPLEAFTFNESLPGPVLRVKLGEEVALRLANELETPLALHWRGVRLANAMDGAVPLTQAAIATGGSFDIAFTPPDAGTFLYHPSVRTQAAAQMARGLAGLLIVEEPKPPVVDLDLALLLADWVEPDTSSPRVLANGALDTDPIALAPGARIRLRLASASTRRMMAIGVEGARVQVAAIDGQPCDLFEPVRQTLPLAPGARYDVFFDLPAQENGDTKLLLRGMSGAPDSSRTLVTFTTTGAARPALPPLENLPANPRLPEKIALEKSKRIDLTIEGEATQGWRINGAPATDLPAKPLFAVKRGGPVTLGFINRTAAPQLMHVHGHVLRHMHLLDDGWEPYWRDSVIVPEGRTIRTAFVADNPGKWLIAGGFGVGDGPAGWFEVS